MDSSNKTLLDESVNTPTEDQSSPDLPDSPTDFTQDDIAKLRKALNIFRMSEKAYTRIDESGITHQGHVQRSLRFAARNLVQG
jgi:hypothetical protein